MYGVPATGGRLIVAHTTQRLGPATAIVWRIALRKPAVWRGSSLVPRLTAITGGSALPMLRSTPGPSNACRLIDAEVRIDHPGSAPGKYGSVPTASESPLTNRR